MLFSMRKIANCKLLIVVIWPVITAKTYSYMECNRFYDGAKILCKSTIESKLRNFKSDATCKRYIKYNAADDYTNCVITTAKIRNGCHFLPKYLPVGIGSTDFKEDLKSSIKCPKQEKTCNTTAHKSCTTDQEGDDPFKICQIKERTAACWDKYTQDCEFIMRRRDYIDLLRYKKYPYNCDNLKLNYEDVVNKECKQVQRCMKRFLEDLKKNQYHLENLCETAISSSEIAASCLKIHKETCPPDKTHILKLLRVIACNLKLPKLEACDESVIFSCRLTYVENMVNIRDDNKKNCKIHKKYTDCIAENVKNCDDKQKFHAYWLEPNNCHHKIAGGEMTEWEVMMATLCLMTIILLA